MQTVLRLCFKLNRRHAERVWANWLCKLFSIGFIGMDVFGGGFLSLDSYRAILVAIVSQTFWCLFRGVSHNHRAICCKMGYRTDVSVKAKYSKGGIAASWGAADLPEKVSQQ